MLGKDPRTLASLRTNKTHAHFFLNVHTYACVDKGLAVTMVMVMRGQDLVCEGSHKGWLYSSFIHSPVSQEAFLSAPRFREEE